MKLSKDLMFRLWIYLFWIFLLFVGIYDLFFVPYRSLIWFASLGLFSYLYFKLENIPQYVYFLLSLVLLLNVFGELFFKFYYVQCETGICASLIYDKILHFFNPIVFATLIYYLSKNKVKDRKMLILFSIAVTFSLGGLWEIIEYGFDSVFGALMQGVFAVGEDSHFFAAGLILDRMSDTIIDMTLNLCGCIVFWFINIIYINRKNLL